MHKNAILSNNNDNYKVVGYNDEQLVFSSKNHKDFESLMASVVKKGLMEQMDIIPISAITKVEHTGNESVFILYNNEKGKSRSASLNIDKNLVADVAAELGAMRDFSRKETEESKKGKLMWGIAGILIAVVSTIASWYITVQADKGIHYYQDSGRRRGIANLFLTTIESIGSIGVLLIGAAITGYLVYRAMNRYKKPAMKVIYE